MNPTGVAGRVQGAGSATLIDPRIAITTHGLLSVGLVGAREHSDVVLRPLGPRIDGADRVGYRF